MKVTDREDVRSFREIGTNLRPQLRKAIVSGAEEREKLRLHASVFQAKVFLVEVSAEAQPFFKIARSFDDIHAGNDSDVRKQKSNDAPRPSRSERPLSD